MGLLINIAIVAMFLALGLFFGSLAEKCHYKRIIKREATYREKVPVFSLRHLPDNIGDGPSQLVGGNVVVSVDYFKRFIASLRLLFGGRVSSYESLLDRGRREALLRMREQAHRKGSNAVFNVKLETASISKGAGNAIGSIEVYAYGTGVKLNTTSSA